MSLTTSEMTPADIRACTCGNDGGNGSGWGGAWGEWIILFLIFGIFGGWGGNRGYGYGGGTGDGVMNNYVLSSDFGQLSRQVADTTAMTERKLDGIANGICDSTYALNNAITGGFAAAQNTMTQGFAGLNTGIVQQGYESRIATQGVGSQLAQCCCDIREGISGVNYNAAMNTNTLQGAIKDCCCTTQQNIKDVNYNLSTQANGIGRQISDTGYMLNTAVDKGFCQTNYNNSTNTRDIIDAQHSDADRILARLDAMEANRMREQLDAARAANVALQGQLDRAKLRTDIVNDVRPCPIPAYPSCNPWANTNTGCCGCTA